MRKQKSTGESEIIETIARFAAGQPVSSGLAAGIGDDAAVFRPVSGEELLFTTDALVEGVHFRREWFSGYELGWKLAAVNLSDIAAMGGKPRAGLLSLAIPKGMNPGYIRRFVNGLIDHLARFSAALAGGNVSRISRVFVADLTLIGSCKKGRAWRRACRPAGDVIIVAGELGNARAGLELLRSHKRSRKYRKLIDAFKKPEPLVDVGKLLARKAAIHGAIDVSDGFSSDLVRLCASNRAGCEVNGSALPISKELLKFCRERGENPVEWALKGGEDYALILSVARTKAEAIAHKIGKSLGIPASVVGSFTRRRGKYELGVAGGKTKPIFPEGWDHFPAQP